MSERPTAPPRLTAILVLFSCSGAVGLLYEVAWVRRLTLVFGNTTHAVSTTLAIFFIGLAAGAALAGRFGTNLTRPIRVYAFLEIALGLYAAATPWAFEAALPVYRAVYQGAPDAPALLMLVRVLLCVAVLGPPTCAMGATLPVLSAGLARQSDALGARIGRLYGWNTAGAALGTWVTGFVLLGRLGVTHTTWLGAGGSIGIGVLALILARSETPAASPGAGSAEFPVAPSPGHARLVIAVMALSGALGLTYELIWTRLCVYALSTTVYAFTTMLVTYLVGLAVGGLAAARVLRRRRATLAHLAWVQLGIGLASAASLWGLLQLPELNRAVIHSPLFSSAWAFHGFRFAECSLVMLAPALFLGATFPLAVDLLSPVGGRAARAVGRLYAWNTFGGVVGSLLAGFVLIPALGTRDLLRVGVAVNALLAAGLILRETRARRRILVGALATLAVAAVGLHGVSLHPLFTTWEFGSVVEYQDEGVTGTVTIHRYPETGVRVLSINGCNVAGTTLPLLTTQKIQGHVPALLHGRARSAMQIGFGSGETAKVLRLHGLTTIHGVELSPEVIRAGDHLAELNGNVAYSREFQTIIMDAVNYARLTDRTYDLILNDSIFPGLAGSSALYTRDHFAACAARLNPGGIFSCWIPLDVTPAVLRMIVASLVDVFPHAQLWLATNCDNKNALLVASHAPLRVDLPAWERVLARPQVGRDLHAIRIANGPTLAGYLLVDTAGMRALAAGAPLNTHDHPRLEYAPYSNQGYHSRWAENLTALLAQPADPAGALLASGPGRRAAADVIERRRTTDRLFLAGLVQDLRLQGPAARAAYEQVLRVAPEHRGAQYALAKLDDGLGRLRRDTPADTSDPEALRRLAAGYWRAGRAADAIPVLHRLLEAAPGDADAEEQLVAAALAAGEPTAASAVIEAVAARYPDDPAWQFNVALFHQLSGASDIASTKYAQLLAQHPDHRAARLALAKLHLRQGAFALGEDVLRGDTTAGGDAQWHYLLALACAGQGRTADARRAVQRAIRLAPHSAETLALAMFLGVAPTS